MPNLLVEVKDCVNLTALNVDTEALLKLPFRGLWLIGPGPQNDQSIHLQTRVFFPKLGIAEDHVGRRPGEEVLFTHFQE